MADSRHPGDAEPAPKTGGRNGRFPTPSRRQISWTVGLVALTAGLGVAAVLTKHSSTPASTAVTSTTTASPTTPGTTPDVGEAVAAINLEIDLREKLGGCWQNAEPGGPNGAYRQDFHYPSGHACLGSGWDLDIQFFSTTEQAQAAATRLTRGASGYTVGTDLVEVSSRAAPSIRDVLNTQPGVTAIAS
jgi:hypothetical protein